jgi:S1-C subfamily serine protease
MPATRRLHLTHDARRALVALLVATLASAFLLTAMLGAIVAGAQLHAGVPVTPGRGSDWLTSPAASTTAPQTGAAADSGAAEVPTQVRRAAAGLVEITSSTDSGQNKAGTGIVVSATGTVITNYHVISAEGRDGLSDSIQVEDPATDTTFTAEVLGTDRAHDIAVLQLRYAENLPIAPLGHSRGLRLGQTVISIGNAYGAGQLRATRGVISGLRRSIASTTHTPRLADSSAEDTASLLTGLIRVNTMIVPGDSGGALVDAHGRVVALIVAYSHQGLDGAPVGIGWAIPIDTARAIASQIAPD